MQLTKLEKIRSSCIKLPTNFLDEATSLTHFPKLSVLVLNTGRARPALGEAQLELVTDAHEENVVGLLRPGQDLLEAGDLLRPQTAADAELVVGAAASEAITVLAGVSLGQAGVGVAAARAEQL